MQQPYRVERGDASKQRQWMMDLWRGNLGHGRDLDRKHHWLYEMNPTGRAGACFLWHGEEPTPVGVGAIAGRDFVREEKKLSGGILADFAIQKQHRTLFPGMLLQKALCQASRDSFDFVYGFPNQNAAPVFQRVGYQLLGEATRYARVLRTRPYFQRRLPDALAAILAPVADFVVALPWRWRLARASRSSRPITPATFDARFDELWNAIEKTGQLIGVRDHRFLSWRFGGDAPAPYGIFACEAPKDGRLIGYAVYTMESDGMARIHDFLARDSEPALRTLLVEFFSFARQHGCHSVSVEFFGDRRVTQSLRALGFSARGSRAVFISAREQDSLPLDSDAWYLTAGDEDQ